MQMHMSLERLPQGEATSQRTMMASSGDKDDMALMARISEVA